MPPNNYARVAVFLPIRRAFDYLLPPVLRGRVVRGSICQIPFHGVQERGLVVDVLDEVDYEGEMSEIEGLVVEEPLDENLLQLGHWLAESTLTPLGQVFNRMVPSNLSVKPRRKKVYEISAPFEEVKEFIEERSSVAPKQVELLESLLSSDARLTGKGLRAEASSSRSPLDALVERGLVAGRDVPDFQSSGTELGLEVDSSLDGPTPAAPPDAFATLNVHGSFRRRLAAYEAFIDRISPSASVLVVTPSIPRAEEMADILDGRGYCPLPFHSGLTPGEASARWRMARAGEVRVFIGVVNSIYLPFMELGGIIVEGEGHRNYRLVDQDPKGDLVDVCLRRGEIEDVPVLVGDSAPSVGAYYDREVGDASDFIDSSVKDLVSSTDLLQDRAAGAIDGCGMSNRTIDLIGRSLEKNERVVLIGERTSSSSAMICRDCGEVIRFPECEVPLKFTSEGSYGLCPYCGYRQDLLNCPNCGGTNLGFIGPGLEKVERELDDLFPKYRVERFSSRGGDYDELSRLSWGLLSGDIDLLVGTWAIASYYLYGKVDLLCLLGSDLVLDWSSYRSTEFYFKRVIRGLDLTREGGTVVAETYHASNPSFEFLFSGDLDRLYRSELRSRKTLDYPPYVDLFELHSGGLNPDDRGNMAGRIKETVEELRGVKSVLGPVTSGNSPSTAGGEFKFLIKLEDRDSFFRDFNREVDSSDLEAIRLVPLHSRSAKRRDRDVAD
ncbi:MAG: hypothetical protein ACOC88_00110 [Candidatus Bipolaricaulota bacterium]